MENAQGCVPRVCLIRVFPSEADSRLSLQTDTASFEFRAASPYGLMLRFIERTWFCPSPSEFRAASPYGLTLRFIERTWFCPSPSELMAASPYGLTLRLIKRTWFCPSPSELMAASPYGLTLQNLVLPKPFLTHGRVSLWIDAALRSKNLALPNFF